MRDAAEPESATWSPDREAGAQTKPAFGLSDSTPLLRLQRTAGNAAVAGLVARQGAAAAPARPAAPGKEKTAADDIEVTHLKYACVFVGYDLYGRQARKFVKAAMPEHLLIEAVTMEDAIVKMRNDARKALKGGTPAHIDEIVLISHGNATGFIKIPLIKGKKGTTVETLAELQQKFNEGAKEYERFQEAREELLGLVDENTSVIVRACRVGRVQELVDGLSAFFGGQASLYAAKDFQAFTRGRIGGPLIKTAEQAFDYMVEQGLVPEEAVFTPEEKVRWVAGHLPDGYVPEMFLVGEEHVEEVRHAGADDPAIEAVKDYMGAQLIGLEGSAEKGTLGWAVGRGSERDDAELDPLETAEIIEIASKRLSELREAERDERENWRKIGEKAWWVLRCERAWMRKPEAKAIDPNNPDPIAGLTMPGLSYDSNLLALQASRRPDLLTPHKDYFKTVELSRPSVEPSEEIEDPNIPENRSSAGGATPAVKPYAGRGTDGQAQPPGEMHMPEETITPLPAFPEPPLLVPEPGGSGQKPETALVVRGELKKTFEIKYEREVWYLKVKRAEVTLDGTIDFKGEGKKELLVGGIGTFSSKPGESARAVGPKGEKTLLSEKSESGAFGKIKGGFESGGATRSKEEAATARGMKYEIYLSGEIGWGPVSSELKIVLFGIDETKSGADVVKVLGIKWSPVITTATFDVPLTDGTKAVFSGKVQISIEAEPDWVKISPRLAQLFGRQIATEGAIVAAGSGTAAGGTAAVGAAEGAAATPAAGAVGELIVAGGFLAGAAATIYAYYQSVQDIEDMKELRRITEAGVADFCQGYLDFMGIKAEAGTPGQPLWEEGRRLAEIELKGRLARAAVELNQKYPGANLRPGDPELEHAVREGILKDSRSWRAGVYLCYEQALRKKFLMVWREKNKDRSSRERMEPYVRTHIGIIGEGSDEPDYGFIHALR
jgi:hypothetical protein